MTSTVIKVDTWQKFADVTIETNDLDPVYEFLFKAKHKMGHDWATRFVVHFLCFYDLGGAVEAANVTDQNNFWDYVKQNYHSFPRGTERRHSRGSTGEAYVYNLAAQGDPAHIWDNMYAHTYTDLVNVFQTRFKNCGFGPYFIWKVLDFQERVWGRPIKLTLDEAVKWCPDDPRKAAAAIFPNLSFREALDQVSFYISKHDAPPSYNRACYYQEAETVLCMLKGYFLTKTHTIGDDIDEKHNQLHRWPELQAMLPPKQDWSIYERHPLVAS